MPGPSPLRFLCPLCQCSSFEEVLIYRPGREAYRLPVYACCGCSLTFTDPTRITLCDRGAYQRLMRPQLLAEPGSQAGSADRADGPSRER